MKPLFLCLPSDERLPDLPVHRASQSRAGGELEAPHLPPPPAPGTPSGGSGAGAFTPHPEQPPSRSAVVEAEPSSRASQRPK